MAVKSRNLPIPAAEVSAPYEPTEQERAAIEAFRQRRQMRTPAPALKLTENNEISVDHPDSILGGTLLLESLGLSDGESYAALMHQITNAARKGKDIDLPAVNGMLAMIQAIEPTDMIEVMLASQMAAVHNATMTFARRLNHVETIPQQDSASNGFNKLARTFATLVEALNRHRGKGQQAIRVEHVTVQAGGQAIVAGSVQGGGATSKLEAQPHAKQITHAPVAPLPSQDKARDTVPITESEEPEAVPDARRC